IAHGRCWAEGGAPAYWPWIQVLQDCGVELERLLVGGAPNAAASTVLPAATRDRKARPAPYDVDPEDAQLRLFAAVSRTIVGAAPRDGSRRHPCRRQVIASAAPLSRRAVVRVADPGGGRVPRTRGPGPRS